MLKIICENKNSNLLIVTPLLTGHKVSKETQNSIKRNKISYTWISYESDGKHAFNVQKGIDLYEKNNKLPDYIVVLDNDITLGRNHIDRMMSVVEKSSNKIGYIYCPFEYRGFINVKFPPMEFDVNRLLRSNYISSNSLYKTSMIKQVGGFIVDEDTHRLSDWAMWLKCLKFGYIGKLCSNTSFVAISTERSISSGGNDEYIRTVKLLNERYILPLL